MSYRILENETLVELMPFNALDSDGGEDEQGHSSTNPYYDLNRITGQWSWNNEEGTTSFGERMWQRMANLIESLADDARNTGRIQRRSTAESIQYRRRKVIEIALVIGGAFLIIIGLEYGVNSIYVKHANPKSGNTIQWEADDDSWMIENNDENLGFRSNKNAIPTYNMPVNRILCELHYPMFKLLGEELDHLCYQSSKMLCSKFDSSADPKEVFERDDVLYNPDGSKFGQPTSSFNCQETLKEVWSPLLPGSEAYDRTCQGARTIKQNNVHTNRFCQPDDSIDWSKLEELIPECISEDNDNFSDNANGLTCNGVSWAVIHEQMGGPLDCKELRIAYFYKGWWDDPTMDLDGENNYLCH